MAICFEWLVFNYLFNQDKIRVAVTYIPEISESPIYFYVSSLVADLVKDLKLCC